MTIATQIPLLAEAEQAGSTKPCNEKTDLRPKRIEMMTDLQTHPETTIGWLADYSQGLTRSDIPDDVLDQATLCLLDTVGCIIAGARTAEAKALFHAETEQHGDLSTWPQEVTARMYGYFGDVLELNDLIGGHSSIGVLPAALSGIEGQDVSGLKMLRAIVAGTEVTARLYESSIGQFKPYGEGGTVVVSYFNSIGAAAALAVVRTLSGVETSQAMAMASAMNTWCPAEAIFGQGGTIKPMLFGANPASCAVQAVSYARHGLTGPQQLVESPIGLMTSLANGFDSTKLRDSDSWFITRPQRKLHAMCGYTHSSIDAAHAMKIDEQQLGNIVSIDVAVPSFFKEAVGKIGAPDNPNDARFHLGYAVALSLQGVYPILPEHTLNFRDELDRGRTREMSERVRIVSNEGNADKTSKPYNVSTVTINFGDGSTQSSTCLSPKGASDNPMSEDEVVQKFIQLVAPTTGGVRAQEFARTILGLRDVASMSHVSSELREILKEELMKR